MQQANAERAFQESSAQRLTVTAESRIARRWCLSATNRMSSKNSLQFYLDFKHRNFYEKLVLDYLIERTHRALKLYVFTSL